MEAAGIGSWLKKRELLTPTKEAVVDGKRRINYQQLNQRVNRLSSALQAGGPIGWAISGRFNVWRTGV